MTTSSSASARAFFSSTALRARRLLQPPCSRSKPSACWSVSARRRSFFDPDSLPVDSEGSSSHVKVLELAELTKWSDGHVWCSPEHHGSMSGVMKLIIDYLPSGKQGLGRSRQTVVPLCRWRADNCPAMRSTRCSAWAVRSACIRRRVRSRCRMFLEGAVRSRTSCRASRSHRRFHGRALQAVGCLFRDTCGVARGRAEHAQAARRHRLVAIARASICEIGELALLAA